MSVSRRRIGGLIRLFRFELPVAAGVCVLLGQILALGRSPTAAEATLGFVSVFCASAAALILNDYFDREADRVNAPSRPLPAGVVTERDVLLLFVVVTLFGFVAGYLVSPAALATLIAVWAVGLLYNWRFKKTGLWGNLMVSFSVGMTFIYGGIVVGEPFEMIVWYFGLLVFLIDLGEEIAADAMDIAGDQLSQSRSLAVRFSPEGALKVSAAIFAGVVLMSFLPFLFGHLEWVYFLPLAFLDGVIGYATGKLLDAKDTNRRRYIRWIYLSGSLALVIFILIHVLR